MLLVFLREYLHHVTVVRSTDLLRHLLTPGVGLVVTGGTLYVRRVALRLEPGPADSLPGGAVVVRVVITLL